MTIGDAISDKYRMNPESIPSFAEVKNMKITAQQKLAAAKIAAKNMIAAADAAEFSAIERGYPLTDEELKTLGYVEEEGGTWGLDIPDSVAMAIWEEQKNG